MHCSLHSLFVVALVLNAHLLVSSDENVTTRAEPSIAQVETTPQGAKLSGENPGAGNLKNLPMEGGGSVTVVHERRPTLSPAADESGMSSEVPRVTEGGATSQAPMSTDTHALNDGTKHTDVEKLLETESEGGARKKSSSIVARKGAPPEAPGVTEEVQSLFNDETKNYGSAISGCHNSTQQVNTSVSSNCSNDKLAIVTAGVASTTPASNPQVASGKQSDTATAPKPVTSNELSMNTVNNNTIKNSTATMQNTTHNGFLRKKFKPATTSDIDEPKEQQLTPDTPASKGDYIIPIIGIVLAVPMVVILFMFFYKRSAEFWERRHYKRMDFLIDGMYND